MTADERDARLNRALAERLEPLASCLARTKEDADRIPAWRDYRSPKGLWTSLHGGCEARRFDGDDSAAVALAEAYAKFSGNEVSLIIGATNTLALIDAYGEDAIDKFRERDVMFPRAVRDAVAAALGIEVSP